MTGFEWVDQVCVTEEACVKKYEFFLVNNM